LNPLVDPFGRIHNYLRISVTDQCNLRCVYCMPAEGVPFTPRHQLLTADEIAFVVRALAKIGLRRVRITGGEPLLRPDLAEIVRGIRQIREIDDIALTTNGIFLAGKAQELAEAGVNRVNVSLDSMQAETFAAITRGGDVARVLQGIQAAGAAGMQPVKVNTVLVKGFNDREVDDFLQFTLRYPIHVRFIEYMPIGHDGDDWRDKYLPLTFVLERIRAQGYTVVPVTTGIRGNGPSETYQIQGAVGTVGLIHPVSDHFCERCNRLRLTADGRVKACLYWDDERDVRPYLGDERAVQQLFLDALAAKPRNHEMALALSRQTASHTPTKRRMSQIGG
jgi:cyclic pyranopterin phosphate synthase